MPSLRDMADSVGNNPVGTQVGDILPLKKDSPFGGLQNAGEGEQEGCLSGPVGTQEGNGLSLFDLQRNLIQCRERSVLDGQLFYLKHGPSCL